MTIKQVNSGGSADNRIRKSDESHSVSKNDTAGKAAQGSSGSDSFTTSGAGFKGDIEFARNALANLESESLSSLQQIKSRIQGGAYNQEEVHQKVGMLMRKDLDSLESMLSALPESPEAAGTKTFTPEYRQYLIENPSVVREVADRISRDINNF